jgi:hypothetical protein
MHVEYLFLGRMVRVPRKVKKHAKKNGVTITAKTGKKSWLGVIINGK